MLDQIITYIIINHQVEKIYRLENFFSIKQIVDSFRILPIRIDFSNFVSIKKCVFPQKTLHFQKSNIAKLLVNKHVLHFYALAFGVF